MSLNIKIRRYEHVIIECPMEDRDQAFKWMDENNYGLARGGWSGPAINKDMNGTTYDMKRYHVEGEKEMVDA